MFILILTFSIKSFSYLNFSLLKQMGFHSLFLQGYHVCLWYTEKLTSISSYNCAVLDVYYRILCRIKYLSSLNLFLSTSALLVFLSKWFQIVGATDHAIKTSLWYIGCHAWTGNCPVLILDTYCFPVSWKWKKQYFFCHVKSQAFAWEVQTEIIVVMVCVDWKQTFYSNPSTRFHPSGRVAVFFCALYLGRRCLNFCLF